MKRFLLVLFTVLSLIILIRLGTASAQETGVTTMSNSTPMMFPGDSWSLRVESEAKSTRDKKSKNVDGYQTQTDLRVYRDINSAFAVLLGVEVNQQDRRQTKEGMSADEAVIGLRSAVMIGDLKIKTDWTYNAILNDKARADEQADGYFEMENRTNFLLGDWGKARLRLKHWEYLVTQPKNGIELRTTKLEFAPGYYVREILVGIRSQFIAHAYYEQNTMTTEIGPFIRYEGVNFEPIAKIIYRPVNDSQAFKLAGNWEREPIYSVEIDLKF